MDKRKINKIYDAVINKEEITLKTLLSWNFTEDEVKWLVKSNILKYVDGVFLLANVDGLVIYAQSVYWQKNYAKSDLIFKRIMEIDPDCSILVYKEIYDSIRHDSYKLAAVGIKKLANYDMLNARMLTFLLVYAYPSYRNILEDIKDVQHYDCLRYMKEDYPEMIKVRQKLASFQFSYALGLILEINYEETLNFRCEVIKRLTYKCLSRQEIIMDTINKYFADANMSKLRTFLEQQPFLDEVAYAIHYLLCSYDEMLNTGIPVEITENNKINIYSFIYHNNFSEALKLLQEGSEKNKRASSKKAVFACLGYLLEENLKLQQKLIPNQEMVIARVKRKGEKKQ